MVISVQPYKVRQTVPSYITKYQMLPACQVVAGEEWEEWHGGMEGRGLEKCYLRLCLEEY